MLRFSLWLLGVPPCLPTFPIRQTDLDPLCLLELPHIVDTSGIFSVSDLETFCFRWSLWPRLTSSSLYSPGCMLILSQLSRCWDCMHAPPCMFILSQLSWCWDCMHAPHHTWLGDPFLKEPQIFPQAVVCRDWQSECQRCSWLLRTTAYTPFRPLLS